MRVALVALLLSLQVKAGCNCMCDDGAVFHTTKSSDSITGYSPYDEFDFSNDYIREPEDTPPEQAEVTTLEAVNPWPDTEIVICDYNSSDVFTCFSL